MTIVAERTAIRRIDQNHRRARVVVHGDTIYLAGQCGDDMTGDAGQQTREALARIDRLLAEAGSDNSRLLSVQIWLSDMADFDAVNAVYDAWVVSGETPARCCGEVKLAVPGARVEIIAVAAA